MFDAVSPTWRAYGRAVFVTADTFAEAQRLAVEAAQSDYPESTIHFVRLGESTPEAAASFKERKACEKAWMENNRRGIPNDRKTI